MANYNSWHTGVEIDTAVDEVIEADANGGIQTTLVNTGASIGQIVKVVEVDDNGKPNKWQSTTQNINKNLIVANDVIHTPIKLKENIFVDYQGAPNVHIVLGNNTIDDWFEIHLSEILKGGVPYTLSFDCSGVEDFSPIYYIESRSKTTDLTEFKLINGRISQTFTLVNDADDHFLLLDGKPWSHVGGTNIILSNFKLEEGEQATAYIAEDINSISNEPKTYVESTFGWNCTLVNNDNFLSTIIKTINAHTPTVDSDGVLKSDYIYMPTPYPITNIGFSGSFSSNGGYLSNVQNIGNAILKFRIFYPQSTSFNVDTSYFRALLSASVYNPDATPNPNIICSDIAAQQMQDIAQSYIDAKDNGRKFSYGKNWLYNTSNILNDSTGAGKMECDTFAGLILRGIAYQDSPYTNTTPNATFDYDNLILNPQSYEWCDKILHQVKEDKNIGIVMNQIVSSGGSDVRFAAGMAWLFWELQGFGLATVFTDASQAQRGDFVFWKNVNKSDNVYFDNITHIAFIGEIENEKVIYEMTSNYSGDLRCIPLSSYAREPAYFARFSTQ